MLRLFDRRVLTGAHDPDSVKEYLQIMDTVRQRGYAVNDGRTSVDEVGLAAPVRDHRGETVAAVLLAAPRFRVAPHMLDPLALSVVDAARDVAVRLGYRPGASPRLINTGRAPSPLPMSQPVWPRERHQERDTVNPDLTKVMTMQSRPEPVDTAKSCLRTKLITARRALPETERSAARAAVSGHLRWVLRGMSCIAAFYPVPTEPLDPLILSELAANARVLIPVVTGPTPLDWASYDPAVGGRRGAGIGELTGARLGPDAITAAEAILVPALAVSGDGRRLGRGGGYYDRTLDLLDRLTGTDRRIPLIAVIYDDELLDRTPFAAHDHPVTAVITPRRGLRTVGSSTTATTIRTGPPAREP